MLIFVEARKSEKPAKNPQNSDKNQQQTQPPMASPRAWPGFCNAYLVELQIVSQCKLILWCDHLIVNSQLCIMALLAGSFKCFLMKGGTYTVACLFLQLIGTSL